MTDPATSFVLSIGHGRRPFADVAADLERHAVGVVVDVRSVPYSRHNPEFTHRSLTELTSEQGIGYRWLGDRLGGKPDDPELILDGVPNWVAIAASPKFAAGIDELCGIITATTAAVLCAEVDPAHCHRSVLIAPALEAHGIRMRHILADGTAVNHQPPLAFP